MITTDALLPSAVSARTSDAIFAAIVAGVSAADDHAIVASTAPAKQRTKLRASRGAKKALLEWRFIGELSTWNRIGRQRYCAAPAASLLIERVHLDHGDPG